MYHSPAAVLLQHLIDEGIATDTGEWQGFENFMPDDSGVDDNIIVIHDSIGTSDGRIHRTGESVEHPGVQIIVRGTPGPSTYRKAQAVADALDAIVRTSVVLEAHTYTIQAATKRPTLSLGREQDARQRFRFAVNAILSIKETI